MSKMNQVCRFDHSIGIIVYVHILTVLRCLCKRMSVFLGSTLSGVGVKGMRPAFDWKGHRGPAGGYGMLCPFVGLWVTRVSAFVETY